MTKLTTIFNSNSPVECHILKGRLETEGISCFIFDEQIISVHPFIAVAIGGVKLKVPDDKINQSLIILKLISSSKLIDEDGEYPISDIFDNEIKRQNEILALKNEIRNDETLLQSGIDKNTDYIEHAELEEIINQERDYLKFSKKKFDFSWDQFLNELFDFERSVFKYLRSKPVNYYLEKEIVDKYIMQKESLDNCHCPRCNSENVLFGYAIDYKWDITYLLISLILTAPLFLIRKKYHCFECGLNYKKQKTVG